MKKLTKFVCLVLICVLFLSTPVKAAQETDIQPLYDYVSTIQLILDINTSTGLSTSTAKVVPLGYLPVDVELRLQRYINGSWVTFKSWEASDTGKVTMEKLYYVYSGYSYRLWVKATVYNSSGTVIDTVTETSSTHYYP